MTGRAVRNVGVACIYLSAILMFLGMGLYVVHYLADALSAMSR